MTTNTNPVTLDELKIEIPKCEQRIVRLKSELDTLRSQTPTNGISERIANIETAVDHSVVLLSQMGTAQVILRADQVRAGMANGTIKSEYAVERTDGVQHMRRVDPWRDGADLRDRSKAAVDEAIRSNDYGSTLDADKLDRMIDAPEAYVSDETRKYIIATGSPAYRSAFAEWLRNPTRPMWTSEETQAMRFADSVRAAMSLTTANGGALVPYMLDPTINLTNSGTASPYRQIANVVTIAGATEWRGVTSAGVNAEWLAEGTEAADASPTFAQPAISTHKGMAYLFGSEPATRSTCSSPSMTASPSFRSRRSPTTFTVAL